MLTGLRRFVICFEFVELTRCLCATTIDEQSPRLNVGSLMDNDKSSDLVNEVTRHRLAVHYDSSCPTSRIFGMVQR